jgi:hypothetical protein
VCKHRPESRGNDVNMRTKKEAQEHALEEAVGTAVTSETHRKSAGMTTTMNDIRRREKIMSETHRNVGTIQNNTRTCEGVEKTLRMRGGMRTVQRGRGHDGADSSRTDAAMIYSTIGARRCAEAAVTSQICR